MKRNYDERAHIWKGKVDSQTLNEAALYWYLYSRYPNVL